MSHVMEIETPSSASSGNGLTSANGQHRLTLADYTLNVRQSYVVDPESWSNDILYGGAKGGGKSFMLRWLFCIICKAFPGAMCYLFRRTYEELWKNHMEGPTSFPNMLVKEVGDGDCAIVGKEIRWRHGSRIFLNHMQLEKHKFKYQGQEIHVLGFDEATQFTETQIRYVIMSLRLGLWRPEVQCAADDPMRKWLDSLAARLPLLMLTANPGGVGHRFIKASYVDQGAFKIQRRTEEGGGGSYRQFIPARAEDNPELLRNDPLYLDRLEASGDPELVRAMREGDWEVVLGSMFGEVWRKKRIVEGKEVDWHECTPFPIPLGWSLWRGGDDGFAAPAAIYWLTRNPDTDTIYVVSEIYQARLTSVELGEKILERDRLIQRYDPREKRTVLNREELRGNYDSSAFANVGQAEITRGDQMNRMDCHWEPCDKWAGSRIARVQMFHQLLKPNVKEKNLRPGIVFFRNCNNAIRSIPQIMRDPNPPHEDVSDDSELHAFDGVTYGVQYKELTAGRVRVF